MSQTPFAELSNALDRLEAVDGVSLQLKQLEETREKVNGWAVKLPALVAQYQLFVRRRVPTLAPAPEGEKVRNAVAAARAKNLTVSPLEIKSGRTLTNLEKAVTKVIDEYTTAIKQAWEGWVQGQTPRSVNADLVTFENDQEYREVVEQIRKRLTEIKREEQNPAESETDFVRVETAAAALRSGLGRLPINAPVEVKAFLAAATTKEGAPLSLLTPTVDEWLKANQQSDKYRIRR